MELTTAQIVVLGLVGVIYGFTKTGILGLSTLAVPLMLMVFTPRVSLGIVLPVLVFADAMTLIFFRRSVKWKCVAAAVPLSLIGVFIGWRFLTYAQTLPDETADIMLRRVIAVVLAFVVLAGILFRWHMAKQGGPDPDADNAGSNGSDPIPASRLGFFFASIVALIGGVITMIANNSGPAWVVFLMQFRLSKFYFLGTAAWIFFIQNSSKLPFSLQLGYVTMETIYINIYMIPCVVGGLLLGRFVVGRLNQKLFDNITQGMALLSSIYLLLTN